MTDHRPSNSLLGRIHRQTQATALIEGDVLMLLCDCRDEIQRLESALTDANNALRVEREIANKAEARAIASARTAHEPADDLYTLLVRRGYAQHEAHAIAYGDKLAVLSTSEQPSESPETIFRSRRQAFWRGFRDGFTFGPIRRFIGRAWRRVRS